MTTHVSPKTLLLRRTFSQPSSSLSLNSKPYVGDERTQSHHSSSLEASSSSSGGGSNIEAASSDAVESLLLLAAQHPQPATAATSPNKTMGNPNHSEYPNQGSYGLLRKSVSVGSASVSAQDQTGSGVNYHQRMRERNNEASKRCRLKRRIKQESLDHTRKLLERHRSILKQRVVRLEKIKILLTEAYHQFANKSDSDGHCNCVSYCQKIWEIKDEISEKNDVSNEQLIRESTYLRKTNLEDMIGAEMSSESSKPLRRGPRKIQEFDENVILQNLSQKNNRSDSGRSLSDSQSSENVDEFPALDFSTKQSSIHAMDTDNGIAEVGCSEDIEVLRFNDRSNNGALDLSNKDTSAYPKQDMKAGGSANKTPLPLFLSNALRNRNSAMGPSPLHSSHLDSSSPPAKVILAPKRKPLHLSMGPRLAPDMKMNSPSTSVPSLTPKSFAKLQPRDNPAILSTSQNMDSPVSTTIIVTPLTSSLPPTLLTIPINSGSLTSPPFPKSLPSPKISSLPPSLLSSPTVSSMPPMLLPSSTVSAIPPSLLPSYPLPFSQQRQASSPAVLIKSEPETIIKTEEDDFDMNNSRSGIDCSQGTIISSQGSSQMSEDTDDRMHIDEDRMHIDDNLDYDEEPQLTINTDEVDGPGSPAEQKPEIPKCAAAADSSCSGPLVALNQLNQHLDLKTMQPSAPGAHTCAEKYIIMSKLHMKYWQADEKPSWICSKHRPSIVNSTDNKTCYLCNKNKKASGPMHIISYRVGLEYYMTQGKFLDIGRAVCQNCRVKTLKGFDFIEALTINNDEDDTSTDNSKQEKKELIVHNAIANEKSINLPVMPRPPLKLKSLAAIQPVRHSSASSPVTARALPIRSDNVMLQPTNQSMNMPKLIKSDSGNFTSTSPVDKGSFSRRVSFPPRRQNNSSFGNNKDRVGGSSDIGGYENIKNKINHLNSAIQQLNPSYQPLGFSITKLSNLGPSTRKETLSATQIAIETILTSIAPGEERELFEAVLPNLHNKLKSHTTTGDSHAIGDNKRS